MKDRDLLKLGGPVQSDGEVTHLKSHANNISFELAGSKYARSWLKKVSRCCLFSALDGAYIFIIHVSLKSPGIPLTDGSRLMLLRDTPSSSSIAVLLLSMPSLANVT